ncbi:DUF7373 family lipoprotein [Nocardia grenadensis]
MHRPGRAVLHGICATMTAGLLLTTLAGCGSVVAGEAVRAEPDLSGLDVGNYPTEPAAFGIAEDHEAARYREGQRLGDFVALPFEIDSSYVNRVAGTGGPVVRDRRDMQSLVINDTFDEVAADLITGWVHTWSTGGDPGTAQQVSIAVLMFPDPTTADSVARGLEHDDFTFNTDNRPVQLPKYPQSKAHWRPGHASIRELDRPAGPTWPDYRTTPRSPEELRTSANIDIQEAQFAQLRNYEPTPEAELADLPVDRDGLLSYALPDPDGAAEAVMSANTALHLLQRPDLTKRAFDDARVDLVVRGEPEIHRAGDERAADRLLAYFIDRLEPEYLAVDSPPGMPQAYCAEDPDSTGSLKCLFTAGRYSVIMNGTQIQDLHQKVSAQYKLLEQAP